MKDHCVILVFNRKYLGKSHQTISQLRGVGKYKDDIVCLIGNDLRDCRDLYKDENIIIREFDEINREELSKIVKDAKITDGREKHKSIALHKFYCFHKYFRENYKKCLYIDTGMHILKPLDKIINLDCENKLLAHSDAYPTYKWKLYTQFDGKVFKDLFAELKDKYDLNIDYFQSGMMLYNTKIIKDDTFDKLQELAGRYINTKNNDQGVLNLYFNCIRGLWHQIRIKDKETYYYDFWERDNLKKNDYIMLKYPDHKITRI